jgi:sec-independent protein translocase protein TatA
MDITTFNTVFLAMPGFSEMLPILLIALLIFGGKKIPELMKGLGSGIREFNDAKNNVKKEIQESATEKETKSFSFSSNNFKYGRSELLLTM